MRSNDDDLARQVSKEESLRAHQERARQEGLVRRLQTWQKAQAEHDQRLATVQQAAEAQEAKRRARGKLTRQLEPTVDSISWNEHVQVSLRDAAQVLNGQSIIVAAR
jgi:hypothetical protein